MNFPGVYLLHLAVLKTLGAGDVAWRLFDLAWLGMTAAAIAALASGWGRRAAIGGGAFLAGYHAGAGAWNAGQRDFLLCPFLLAGALGVVSGSRRGLLLAGLALGAGVMIKPHAVVLALALTALVIVAPRSAGSRWVPAVIFVAGLTIVP